MQRSLTENAGIRPESTVGPLGRVPRIASIDLLRGLVMILMALDHTRHFFGIGGSLRDVGEPTLFLTRWITHFCAPTFVFLAGLSAFLFSIGRSSGETARFLFTRGLFLILVELTLIRFAWSFNFNLDYFPAGVIWVIGLSMVLLAGLIYLPRWLLLAFALGMIAGHNLLDGMAAQDFGQAAWLWQVLHERGSIVIGETLRVYVLYPLIPWIGVMALGYAMGPIMLQESAARRRLLFGLGAAVTLGFVLLRASNLYGDPTPWIMQADWLATLLAFLDCEKYPPSLLFLMMTLGPALMLLALFDRMRVSPANPLVVFGQVPFFFYVAHLYLIHALALLAALLVFGAGLIPLRQTEAGLALPGVYFVWLIVLLLLYPVCRWFADLKAQRREAIWRYL
jgi:uncharacterized membrane protein